MGDWIFAGLIMRDDYAAIGMALVFAGGTMLVMNHRASIIRPDDATQNEGDCEYHCRQCHLRMLTGGTLLLLGILMTAGEIIVLWGGHLPPSAFLYQWHAICALTLFVIILGLVDALRVVAHARTSLDRRRKGPS